MRVTRHLEMPFRSGAVEPTDIVHVDIGQGAALRDLAAIERCMTAERGKMGCMDSSPLPDAAPMRASGARPPASLYVTGPFRWASVFVSLPRVDLGSDTGARD